MGARFAIGSVLGYLFVVSWVCSFAVLGMFETDGPKYHNAFPNECVSEYDFIFPVHDPVPYTFEYEIQCAMFAHHRKVFSYTYREGTCVLNGEGLGELSSVSTFRYGITDDTELEELANGKSVYASPLHADMRIPENAVDAYETGNFYESVQGWGQSPYWVVDLGDQYSVHKVVIRPRGGCCGDRFRNAEVRAGNQRLKEDFSSHEIHSVFPGIYNTSFGALVCWKPQGVVGRYVSIQMKPSKNGLALYDVKVYGFPIP